MRATRRKDGLTVLAVAGTDVVLLGMHMTKAQAQGLMGFAIRRTNHRTGESEWLRGYKRFKRTAGRIEKVSKSARPRPRISVSTRQHPIQSFQWADFTARPGGKYTYEVIALRGPVDALAEHEAVSVRVTLERRDATDHRVFFNRGAASSQAYEYKFGDLTPDEVGAEAYEWLSRGLFEAYQRFIGKAVDQRWALRAALYECHVPEILAPLGDARRAGVDVRIVFDGRKAALATKNEAALREVGLWSRSRARTENKSDIAHNKFIVALKDGKPEAVWTGSMNLSINGVWGQSNVGHWVQDRTVARAYLDYWQRLDGNPRSKDLRPLNEQSSDLGNGAIPAGTTPLFSPRPSNALLQRIGHEISGARATFITLPFGIVDELAPALLTDDGHLRCMLLDSQGSGANHRANLKKCRALKNVIAAVGNRITSNRLDAWVQEDANPWSTNVEYVHTKYALIDPLSADPIVITGSANFSGPSVTGNDENTLVIRGNRRVADIYLGEFRRLFDHHAYRESLRGRKAGERDPTYLREKPEQWLKRHFDDGGPGDLRRAYFSGRSPD